MSSALPDDLDVLGARTSGALLLKPLSHQGGVLTVIARLARKLRTRRCVQWDLIECREIAMASPWHASPLDAVRSQRTACHGAHLCMPKVCALAWRSHGDLNECRGNAVGLQQQHSNSAVRSLRAPRGRRLHAAGMHRIAARMPL